MSSLDSLAIHLIRAGQWSEAIGLYRDELGISIPQAEEIVAKLADEYSLRHPERFLSWLAIAFGGFSLFAIVAVLQLILSGK